MRAEPANEVQHIRIPPHPLWEALKPAQRLSRVSILVRSAHISVHPIGVGPIGLHCDRGKALFPDQTFRDLGSDPVELVGSVRGLANEDVRRFTDYFEDRIKIRGRADERLRALTEQRREILSDSWHRSASWIPDQPNRALDSKPIPTGVCAVYG